MSRDDFFAFHNHYQHATKANRLALFGHIGKGTVSACRAVANYAANKGAVYYCADPDDARIYETICREIYDRSPEYARVVMVRMAMASRQ